MNSVRTLRENSNVTNAALVNVIDISMTDSIIAAGSYESATLFIRRS